MHIVYLDESGTHAEARHFVVAGLAVFERDTYYLARSLNQLQSRYFPDETEPVNFRVSALRPPNDRVKAPFDSLTREDRFTLIDEIYAVIAEAPVRLFGVAMEKISISGDPYEAGFEQVVSRFDYMLDRVHRDRQEDQRGLIVVAESSYRENLELLARKIVQEGHRWGGIHRLADIPYFAPAKSTRLLQLADFVSNAIFGRYESGFARNFDQIASRFDQDRGKIHGLVHLAQDRRACQCPSCIVRRTLPQPGAEDADL